MLNWIRKYFQKTPIVIDSNEFLKHKHTLIVNPEGKLMLTSPEFYGEVMYLTEWQNDSKEFMNIDTDVTVLDIAIKLKN